LSNQVFLFPLMLSAALLLTSCTTNRSQGKSLPMVTPSALVRLRGLPAETRTNILALDPERIAEREVRGLLAQLPAPQIISIHGGIFPIPTGMNSFAKFLMGMGYPESSIRNPGDGGYTYGFHDNPYMIAGNVAWYYEHHGLRPIMVGHSQGGIQTIRVLHYLAGEDQKKLAVWNPVTQQKEKRFDIMDPLTGQVRPVVGLRIGYATVATAGGLARVLPNEWDMNAKLRKIPDSVEDFTGFQKGMDMAGGDYFGYGSGNNYYATGSASVRNVRLPSTSSHWTIPYAESLLEDDVIRKWIDDYRPASTEENATEQEPEWMTARILWAAEVWHGIKKHWVLELQRLIRSQSTQTHDN
jgi:hypothetical protein